MNITSKKSLKILFGLFVLIIVLLITISNAKQPQDIREHAAGGPSQKSLINQNNESSQQTEQQNTVISNTTITLPPENMRYKAPNDSIAPTLSIISPANGT